MIGKLIALRRSGGRRWRRLKPGPAWCIFVSLLFSRLVMADTNTVTVSAQTCTNYFRAYAQVQPIAALPVSALTAGIVTRLKVLPGMAVRKGQELGRLGGPQVAAALTQARANVKTSQAQLAAARQALTAAREQLAGHLITRTQLAAAQSAAKTAAGNLKTARAKLAAVRQSSKLIAPTNGTVLSVRAANGQSVVPGQTLLQLQPANHLWLRATYYGEDASAIRPGMTGQFLPTDGESPIPVKVVTVFGALAADGGESVGLQAVNSAPGWLNGQYGTVKLNGPVQSLVAVPSRALVLSRGAWWVLISTPQGNRAQKVMPGPVRGWETFIRHGLQPGVQVVVENAYLEFHHGIARDYQPPD